MFALHRGNCEHCHRGYNYELWHAPFGDFSYAYCDTCGLLATIDERNENVAQMPCATAQGQEMDAAWESYLRPCSCGGSFRKGASPRCPHCREALSARFAGAHISRNIVGTPRGWQWQDNWSESYCIAIEDPKNPGKMRHVADPFPDPKDKKDDEPWGQILGLNK